VKDLKAKATALMEANHHREAMVLIAETVGDEFLTLKANQLRWARDRLGYMPTHLQAKAAKYDREIFNLLG
jgi:hypothetical protein